MTPATPAFSVCVYCGSRAGVDAAYAEAARATGQWIGAHGGQLVYGGGRNGLMGIVAQATQEAGGRVVGIIPKALVDKEQANHHCDELHVVDTMHERKAMMAERSDAFVAVSYTHLDVYKRQALVSPGPDVTSATPTSPVARA